MSYQSVNGGYDQPPSQPPEDAQELPCYVFHQLEDRYSDVIPSREDSSTFFFVTTVDEGGIFSKRITARLDCRCEVLIGADSSFSGRTCHTRLDSSGPDDSTLLGFPLSQPYWRVSQFSFSLQLLPIP